MKKFTDIIKNAIQRVLHWEDDEKLQKAVRKDDYQALTEAIPNASQAGIQSAFSKCFSIGSAESAAILAPHVQDRNLLMAYLRHSIHSQNFSKFDIICHHFKNEAEVFNTLNTLIIQEIEYFSEEKFPIDDRWNERAARFAPLFKDQEHIASLIKTFASGTMFNCIRSLLKNGHPNYPKLMDLLGNNFDFLQYAKGEPAAEIKSLFQSNLLMAKHSDNIREVRRGL